MKQVSWINGSKADCIDLADRAVQYGDGLFETIRIMDGRAEFLPRHLARLAEGCARLSFQPVPWEALENELNEFARQHPQGVLKLIMSRGSGERGYRVDPAVKPTRIVSISSLPEWPEQRRQTGIRARLCRTRLARQPALAGIKHLNRLEQVLARAEWEDPAIHEGLMFDSDEHLVEGTMSNLFLVNDGILSTAELSACGVAGVMRSVIIDLATQSGMQVSIRPLNLSDAVAAQEMFVCNSLIGVWPIASVDELGDYEVGPLTRIIATGLDNWTDNGNNNWYAT